MKISLFDLREILRTHPRRGEWDDGDPDAVYLRLGSAERKGLRAETRKRGDELDLVLEIDAEGVFKASSFGEHHLARTHRLLLVRTPSSTALDELGLRAESTGSRT